MFLMIGLIEYAKVSAQAWLGGENIYYDAGQDKFTTASGGNTLAGIAYQPAANPSATGFVYLCPFLVGTNELENVIADPGTGLAIPVTASGVCEITSAGAETRTLAIPTRVGQKLVLVVDVDGGSCVITSAQPINQTGNNTITMNDVADFIELTAVKVGAALRWRVVANDGAVLTTV
jgi:hypothetical protein